VTSYHIRDTTVAYIRATITFDLSMNVVYAGRFVPILYIQGKFREYQNTFTEDGG